MGALRDPFGIAYPVKQLLINCLGYASYWPLNVSNTLTIVGEENLKNLPETGVLLVSNHQTYYMDGIVVYHSVGYVNRPYLIRPKKNFYYVAAEETMERSGWLPRVLAYTGAITVKRSWKEGEEIIKRDVDPFEVDRIGIALKNGWVLTFPQGTTVRHAPGRIGCARLIKQFQPVVLPVVLRGIDEAFGKKNLRLANKKVDLSVEYKKPLEIDYLDSPEMILERVMDAIEETDPLVP
jgi:1-acyl-sn-glycerol-3-phosphate acyltransferase